jgi:hypothetical protein
VKAYISVDVNNALFGDYSANDVLKELVRWMATPTYQAFVKKRGLSSSDSWVDVFKIAVMCDSGPVAPPPTVVTQEESYLDSDINF